MKQIFEILNYIFIIGKRTVSFIVFFSIPAALADGAEKLESFSAVATKRFISSPNEDPRKPLYFDEIFEYQEFNKTELATLFPQYTEVDKAAKVLAVKAYVEFPFGIENFRDDLLLTPQFLSSMNRTAKFKAEDAKGQFSAKSQKLIFTIRFKLDLEKNPPSLVERIFFLTKTRPALTFSHRYHSYNTFIHESFYIFNFYKINKQRTAMEIYGITIAKDNVPAFLSRRMRDDVPEKLVHMANAFLALN